MSTWAFYADPYSGTVVWPEDLPFPADASEGRRGFEVETAGPWSIVKSIRALAVEKTAGGVLIHGDRVLQRPKAEGYAHHGTVKVGGKSRRAFTASLAVERDGRLFDFAVLYVTGSSPGNWPVVPEEKL